MEFAEALRSDDRRLFLEMLNSLQEFSEAFDAKGEEFSIESLLMAITYIQHKMIMSLLTKARVQSNKGNTNAIF